MSTRAEVLAALCDDLNTPQAIAGLHELAGEGQCSRPLGPSGCAAHGLAPARKPSGARGQRAEVEALIQARSAARKDRNFAEADRIRDELLTMGVVIHDNKDGTTTWEVVPSLAASKKKAS